MVAVSLKVISAISVVTVAASFLLTRPLVSVFARPDNPVYDLAVTGNRICTIELFFIGFNIFASGMFTALSKNLAGNFCSGINGACIVRVYVFKI